MKAKINVPFRFVEHENLMDFMNKDQKKQVSDLFLDALRNALSEAIQHSSWLFYTVLRVDDNEKLKIDIYCDEEIIGEIDFDFIENNINDCVEEMSCLDDLKKIRGSFQKYIGMIDSAIGEVGE